MNTMDLRELDEEFEREFDRVGAQDQLCVSVKWRCTAIWDDHERIEVHTQPCLTALKQLAVGSAQDYEGYQDLWSVLADHEIK